MYVSGTDLCGSTSIRRSLKKYTLLGKRMAKSNYDSMSVFSSSTILQRVSHCMDSLALTTLCILVQLTALPSLSLILKVLLFCPCQFLFTFWCFLLLKIILLYVKIIDSSVFSSLNLVSVYVVLVGDIFHEMI